MTKKQLIKKLLLDPGYCTKMEEIDPGTALIEVYKELDPSVDWDEWENEMFPQMLDNYVYCYFDKLVVYGALVAEYDNDIPKEVADVAVLGDILDEDYEWEFTRLEDLYETVYENIDMWLDEIENS